MALGGIDLRTVKACSEDWTAMQGGVRSRHCSLCEKTVHDVARMTPREVGELAFRAVMGEEVCARLTRDAAGELVTLGSRGGLRPAKAAGVVMAAAVAVGSAAAQEVRPAGSAEVAASGEYPECGPLPKDLNAVVHGCWKPQPPATVTGRVLRPDGTPVTGGLLRVSAPGVGSTLYVLDEIGSFELHEQPGTYEIRLQTGEAEGRLISEVELHAGRQEFGDVRTLAGQPDEAEVVVTLGEVAGIKVRTAYWLRHPVMYARYVGYRVRRGLSK